MKKIETIAALIIALLMQEASAPARAQGQDGFYKGKHINVIIYSNAGEAYDLYARLLIRYTGDYIPGGPTFVPKNMTGAGGLKATEYLYKIAPADGTEFGTIGRGIPIEPLLGGTGADFDPLRFTWIGSMNKEVSVTAAWHTAEVKTARDLLTKELIVGGTGGLSDSQLIPTALDALLGTKFKVVPGYNGSTAAMLAVERGELQGMGYHSWSNLKATKPEWFEQHKANVVMQMSAGGKHPELPEVPLVSELATSDRQREALKLLFARELFGRPFLAPPAVPADRAKMLRSAFDATVRDKRLIDEADKAQMEMNPASGEELVALLRQLYALPSSVVDDAKKALGR
jgi:tripartite-type tricarboxylate transporter receptor subunit TctC